MTSDNESLSKYLSYILRHKPEEIGLQLNSHGWADIDELLSKSSASGRSVTRNDLLALVEGSKKKRMALSDDGSKVRAIQGHSIAVEIDLPPVQPPALLYHGTAVKFLAPILETGLEKKERHHVHLSSTVESALIVGRRRGKAATLEIQAARMHAEGFTFLRTQNDVWLTDSVPAKYLRLLTQD